MKKVLDTISRGYFIEIKDEHGSQFYTFYDKAEADEFYLAVSKNNENTRKK